MLRLLHWVHLSCVMQVVDAFDVIKYSEGTIISHLNVCFLFVTRPYVFTSTFMCTQNWEKKIFCRGFQNGLLFDWDLLQLHSIPMRCGKLSCRILRVDLIVQVQNVGNRDTDVGIWFWEVQISINVSELPQIVTWECILGGRVCGCLKN